jgi:parallel beta-helix repeat protein
MRLAVIAVSVGVIVGLFALIVLGIVVTPAITTCGTINESGFYYLSANLEGAPETGVPYFNGACMVINASNVLLTCNGYNITDNGTVSPMTVGIVAMGGHENITIMDCPSVSNYTYGVGLDTVDHSYVINVTAHDNRDAGIYIARDGDHNQIINCTSYGHTDTSGYAVDGYYMHSGTNNTFIDNVAYDNYYGFEIRSGATTTNMTNNTAYLNNHGFRLATSSNNDLDDNTAYNNSRGFYFYQGSGNTFTNNVVYNNSYGFYCLDSSYNTLAGNDAYTHDEMGFLLTGSCNYNNLTDNTASENIFGFSFSSGPANNTLTGNDATLNAADGFNFIQTEDSNLTGNTAYGNGDEGFDIGDSNRSTMAGNVAYTNDFGIIIYGGSNNTLHDNTAYDNFMGILISMPSDYGNTIIDNTAYENENAGISVSNSTNNVLADNMAYDNDYAGISMTFESNNNNLTDNTVYGNDQGIYLGGSHDNNLTGNEAYGNDDNGFHIILSPNNTFTSNDAYDNLDHGFYLAESDDNTFTDNTAYNHSEYGFYLNDGSDNNTLTNNTGYENYYGFYVYLFSDYNTFTDNTAYDNDYGFYVLDSSYNGFTGNWAYNNSDSGFSILTSDDTELANGTANNNGIGTRLDDSDGTVVSGDHYFDNTVDFQVGGTEMEYSMAGVIFDSPAGDLTNYTNLSVNDTILVQNVYSMDHATAPPLPSLTRSFEGKFINITNYTANVSIDSIVWHWDENETTDYTENLFRLWEFDGSWSFLGGALDTDANTMTLTGLEPHSVFAILETYPPDDDDDGGPEPDPLSASLESTCEANTVTVTSSGDPVSNAKVVVDVISDILVLYTGDNGQTSFGSYPTHCGKTVTIKISESGYDKVSMSGALVDCELCIPSECTDDTDCPSDQYCMNGECIFIECPCGEVVDHQCMEYECCVDTDCPEGQVCMDNECQEVPPEEECETDADCAGNKYCEDGNCELVTGACGYVEEHAWVEYECGDEIGCLPCPEGTACVDHACVRASLTGPGEGFIGDSVGLTAKENDEPCADCDVQITDPTGRKLTGKTDASGKVQIPLNTEGLYRITLFKDGVPLASKNVAALARPPFPEEKPLITVIAEMVSQFWLVLLLILLALLLLYWRARKKKKKRRR